MSNTMAYLEDSYPGPSLFHWQFALCELVERHRRRHQAEAKGRGDPELGERNSNSN